MEDEMDDEMVEEMEKKLKMRWRRMRLTCSHLLACCCKAMFSFTFKQKHLVETHRVQNLHCEHICFCS